MPSRSPAKSPAKLKENRAPRRETPQEDEEQAVVQSLFAELMCGTPRQRAAPPPPPPAAEEEPMDADDEDVWEMESIQARRRLRPEVEGGPPGEWQYLIKFIGKPESENRWAPESALDPEWLQQELLGAATERSTDSAMASGAAR